MSLSCRAERKAAAYPFRPCGEDGGQSNSKTVIQDPERYDPTAAIARHKWRGGQWLPRLRFVAAVSVSCSGDKSDKEESAGRFSVLWGLCVRAAAFDALSERDFDNRRRRLVALVSMTLPVDGPFCHRRRNVASDFLRRPH